jgi:hypothetical protein
MTELSVVKAGPWSIVLADSLFLRALGHSQEDLEYLDQVLADLPPRGLSQSDLRRVQELLSRRFADPQRPRQQDV